MAEYFKTSTLWVVDFRYEGRPRRWFKACGPQDDVRERMITAFRDLYGQRAQFVDVRRRRTRKNCSTFEAKSPRTSSVRQAATGSISLSSLPPRTAHLPSRNGDHLAFGQRRMRNLGAPFSPKGPRQGS